ncbi:MAG: DUF72 domain-containing protein [Gammaproteobacteria bacterium]
MNFWVGTSGYNYAEWKGSFYPQKMTSAQMLPYYAERFSTVEINNTFYRMPTETTVAGWSAQTPATFRLTLKAPKRITHDARLKDCADTVQRFVQVAGTLGPKLGALLFQLPPFLKKDVPLLEAFLQTLPPGTCGAFEFRHASWFDDAVYERLRARNIALCVADSENSHTPVMITAQYAYFRLRDEGYTPEDLVQWANVVRDKTTGCSDVYVYFKHEEQGTGPRFARLLLDALERSGTS